MLPATIQKRPFRRQKLTHVRKMKLFSGVKKISSLRQRTGAIFSSRQDRFHSPWQSARILN
jgi:hypothetical protein